MRGLPSGWEVNGPGIAKTSEMPPTPEQRQIAWRDELLAISREEIATLHAQNAILRDAYATLLAELEAAQHDRDMLLADAERLRRELDDAHGVLR